MAKYLHKYSSYGDFNEDYIGTGEVTAITVNSAEFFQSCNDWDNMIETHDYDGTYVFDREEEITNVTDCGGNPQGDIRVKVFKNGNKEIYSVYSNYYGKWGHENGSIDIIQNFSSVGQSGDGHSYNFTPEYAEGPYHEPWVSLTKVNRIVYDYKWYDHVGEVDVYDVETEDYIGKMHLWRREDGRYSIVSETETPGTSDTIYRDYISDGKHLIDTADTATATDVQRGSRVDYNKPWWTVKVLTYIQSAPSNLLADTTYYSSNTVSFNELLTPAFTAWGKRNDLSVLFFYGDTFEDDGVNMFMSGGCDSTSEELTKSDMHVRNATIYDLQNERFVSNDRGQVIMITVGPRPVG